MPRMLASTLPSVIGTAVLGLATLGLAACAAADDASASGPRGEEEVSPTEPESSAGNPDGGVKSTADAAAPSKGSDGGGTPVVVDFAPWTRVVGASVSFYSATSVCSDAAGNVIVTGSAAGNLPFATATDITTFNSNSFTMLAKFDNKGSLVFAKRLGKRGDAANGVATDAAGNIFVALSVAQQYASQGGLGDTDAMIRKYDPSGTEIWSRTFGTTGPDEVRGVAVDASGNAIVVGGVRAALPGQSHGATLDAFVRKYDGGGNVLWTRQFATATEELATGVTTDAASSVYVVGWGATPDGTGASKDYYTVVRKLDAAGTVTWSRSITGSSAPMVAPTGTAIAVGASGEVVVTGGVLGALPGATSAGTQDAFVAKLSAAGAPLWTKQFGTLKEDWGAGVAVDASGNVLVVGVVSGAFDGQAFAGYCDGFLRKLAPDGSTISTKLFGSPNFDYVTSVTLDVGGNAYVAGTSHGPLPGAPDFGFNDAFVMKYPQ